MKHLAIYTSEGIYYPAIDEIMYVEAEDNYSTVYLIDGSKIQVSKSLICFEQVLVGYGFLRPHNNCLVNPKHIRKYLYQDGGTMVMRNKKEIGVSKRKKSDYHAGMEQITIRIVWY